MTIKLIAKPAQYIYKDKNKPKSDWLGSHTLRLLKIGTLYSIHNQKMVHRKSFLNQSLRLRFPKKSNIVVLDLNHIFDQIPKKCLTKGIRTITTIGFGKAKSIILNFELQRTSTKTPSLSEPNTLDFGKQRITIA